MHKEHINPLIKEMNTLISPLNLVSKLRERYNISLLNSMLNDKKDGRYSIMAIDPFMVLRSKGKSINISDHKGTRKYSGDPFYALEYSLKEFTAKEYNVPCVSNYDLPFIGGAIGYIGYDLCHFVEKLPTTTVDDLRVPDMLMAFYDKVIIWDHMVNRMFLVATGLRMGRGPGQTKTASDDIKLLTELVENPDGSDWKTDSICRKIEQFHTGSLYSNYSKEEYEEVVRQAIEYIAAGDIFQVNLSQRFHMELKMDPIDLYIKLSQLNPAPFGGLLHFPDVTVASSSPERFLKVDGDIVETRPIKGTIVRGRDKKEDEMLKDKLRRSKKDNAEHIMIVDLERNDLGRVCEYGSVKPEELCVIEEYATVHHMVSTIKGQLKKGTACSDLLKATFPGGSITGAPKIRAMEIIDELEPVRRGVYTGSMGYIGFNGKLDLNIIIRTFVIKDGNVYFSVGGGIVADSRPAWEYQETLDKGKALIQSLGC